jgi:S-adenosylhomocysteine hydrolase
MTTMTQTPSDIRDLALADEGALRIEWAGKNMPVFAIFGEDNDIYYQHIDACIDELTENQKKYLSSWEEGT